MTVGAEKDDDNGSDSGSVYLFDAMTGVQTAKLLPSDGASGDLFGNTVAISNGIVALGAWLDAENGVNSGSAYVFDASTGAQILKLLPSDGATGDAFGRAVAIDFGIVAVGAHSDDDNGSNSGSVYLFDASTGIQLAKLLANDGAAIDNFGYSVAIGGGVVAVGAYNDDDNSTNSGSAYLFGASTGVQIAKLLPDDGAATDSFGISISISKGIVAVGAYKDDDNGTDSGSVYLFDAANGAFIEKHIPATGMPGDKFGRSVALDSGAIAVGANLDDDNGTDSGSAYIYQTSYVPCRADMTGDGVIDFFDVSVFIAAFSHHDPSADFTSDGSFDFFDVSAFLTAFGIGCQ